MDSSILTPIILIVAGIVTILLGLLGKPAVERLKKTGERCEGIIFELGYKAGVGPNDTPDRKVTVRFLTKKMEWITEDFNASFAVFYPGQYKVGDTVAVLYNPDNPKDFTIETKQSPKLAKLFLSIIGAICIGVGVYVFITRR